MAKRKKNIIRYHGEKKKLQVISMKDEKETLSLGLKIEMYCIRRKTITETCVRMMQTCWLSENRRTSSILIRRNFAQEEIY